MIELETKINTEEDEATLVAGTISNEEPRQLTTGDGAKTDETKLVERIVLGDQRAEEELNNRYRQGMLMVLRNKTGDATLAEDLWQDTLIAVLQAIKNRKIQEPDKLRAFVVGVGKNLVRDYFKKRRGEPIFDDNFIYRGESALEALIRDENAEMVRRAVRKLKPPKYRQLLYRFYIEEQDKETICADLGMTKAQFTVALCRARRKLGKLLVKALGRR